jgi:hypothetical protein
MIKKRKFVRFMLVFGTLSILISICAVIVTRWHPYNALRHKAVDEVGIERLQQWAQAILLNPPKEFRHVPKRGLQPKHMPKDIQDLGDGCYVVYEPGDAKTQRDDHLFFACGGGFYHYGLKIGNESYVPEGARTVNDQGFEYEKISDGVWGMYE